MAEEPEKKIKKDETKNSNILDRIAGETNPSKGRCCSF